MTDEPRGPANFATTRWTVVLAAGGSGPAAEEALAALCSAYWVPLYVFARRRGSDANDAADAVQGFFAALLEKGWAADADPARGRFRSFLLTAFTRYLAKERDKARAAKRGGATRTLSLDLAEGESGFIADPADERTPERVFERRWAMTLLARAHARTRDEFLRTARPALFEALEPFIGGAGAALPYAEIAARLGSSEGAVKVQVHRLRARYRANLRDEVRDTLGGASADSAATEADIDAELRDLLAALAD